MNRVRSQLEIQVDSLLRSSNWEEAIEALLAAPELVASSFELSWSLGWAYFKLGRLLESQSALARAVAISPNSSTGYWALGTVCHEAGDLASAEAHYRRSLELRPGSLPRQSLALLLHQKGCLAEAEGLYLANIRERPQNPERLRDYAAFLSDAGREAESLDLLNSLGETDS